MNAPSLIAVIGLCIAVMAVPRKYLLMPYIIAACLVPMDQRILIADLDFTALRFCVLAGFLRMWFRGEMRSVQWNIVDKLVFAWMLVGSAVYVLQWQTVSAAVYRSGVMFDGFGLYWVFRMALRNWEDIVHVLRSFAIAAILSAPFIILERVRLKSSYSIFGHAPTAFHRGRFRCAGPFPHAIMMGLFWTCLLPWFYACTRAGISKGLFWTAMAAAMVCVVLSGSSTPLMAVVAIVAFLALYKYRSYGRQIATAALIMLVGLHFVMKQPVWHLMSRANVFGGSTGWHRFYLFDEFINHLGEWFLLGTKSTSHWGRGLNDVTNQYVIEGVRGGMGSLAIFLVLLVLAVRIPARASLRFPSREVSWMYWGICVSVLSHLVAFWGVSYFGQIIMLLYLVFAMVALVHDQLERTTLRANL